MTDLKTKKSLIILFLLFFQFGINAAAPDDISTNQRAWFDAVDINGNTNYTDNPPNNSFISQWNDKSGSGNNISNVGDNRPAYRHNNITSQRHGVEFDGSNDTLVDNSDIWVGGAVNQMESFVVATTDRIQSASLFNSTNTNANRLGVHLPWGDSITYFDQGLCCPPSTRLSGAIPITLSQQYFWHFIGLPTQQSVVQDGEIRLNDANADTYNILSGARFTLGGFTSTNSIHNGRVFEGIFYQRALNNAERRIINSYLSAKWNKSFSASPNFADAYAGDNPANGNYDYFVGGIGQDNGSQTTGTSQGLTITNTNFLNGNGKFILAGVNYLTTTPTTGLVITDTPAPYNQRSNRTWYIDSTGTGGLVNLSFNAATIGIPVVNGEIYGLLHRTGTSGMFTEVATTTMSGGVVTFSHLPADGVYSVARLQEVNLEFKKTRSVASDPINGTTNPKSIPGALIDYTLAVKNTGDGKTDANTTTISDNIAGDIVLFTGNLNGSGNPFIFTDNSCPPATNTQSSSVSITYPTGVTYRDGSGSVISPNSDFDAAIRSFEITLTGSITGSIGTNTPCFTLQYRTRIE